MRHANPAFEFGRRERRDIVKAWLLTSLAFAIFFIRVGILDSSAVGGFTVVFVLALLTAGVGFIVHELCHKYVAHRFRVHGEFIANNTMLVVSVLFAFMGVLFAAPGAVHIGGRITRRENGIISAAGPASNMVLTLLFLPLAFLPGLPGLLGMFGVWINAILGGFNLIPFFNLDGSKILAWNSAVYFLMVAVAAVQVAGAFLYF